MFSPMVMRLAWILVACFSSACLGTKAPSPPSTTPEARPEGAEASQGQSSRVPEPAPSEPANRERSPEEEAQPARCALPFERGPCKAAFSVYWFDPERRACEPRIYGGCAGNENRFEDLESCEAACLGSSR